MATIRDYPMSDLQDTNRSDFPWTLYQFMHLEMSRLDFRIKGTSLEQVKQRMGKADKVEWGQTTAEQGQRVTLTYLSKDVLDMKVILEFEKHQHTYYLVAANFWGYTADDAFKVQKQATPVSKTDYDRLRVFDAYGTDTNLNLTKASTHDQVVTLLGYPRHYSINLLEGITTLFGFWHYQTGNFSDEGGIFVFEKDKETDIFHLIEQPDYSEIDGKLD